MNRHEEYVKAWQPEEVAWTDVDGVVVSTVIRRMTKTHRVAETRTYLYHKQIRGLVNYDYERGPVEQAQEQHDRWVAKVRQAVQA
jgi:hypothetical protein